MLLNNEWVNNEIKDKIKKYLKTNENERRTTKNLGDTIKGVLRRNYIAIQAYLKKTEKSQINNLTLHLKDLEEQQQPKPRVSRRKDIIKIRTSLNDIESKKTIQKINECRSWFFENVDKPLTRLIKKKRKDPNK